MKNLSCLFLFVIASASAASAQAPDLPEPQSDDSFFIPARQPQANHEASYQHYETPQQLVHRNAALRGAQRRERMAINARWGYSPSRPPSSTVPFMGSPIGPPVLVRSYAAYPGFVFPRTYIRF
ncbi:MAG: hypothetical protein O3C40_27560 [Planctomycetota bacterium]|nr:hypothetical protein [Planctomycetota bacterium]